MLFYSFNMEQASTATVMKIWKKFQVPVLIVREYPTMTHLFLWPLLKLMIPTLSWEWRTFLLLHFNHSGTWSNVMWRTICVPKEVDAVRYPRKISSIWLWVFRSMCDLGSIMQTYFGRRWQLSSAKITRFIKTAASVLYKKFVLELADVMKMT